MNILSLITFLCFFIYLYFGFYVLNINPKSKLNQVFFALCLSLSIWAFAYSFMLAAPNRLTAMVWRNYSAIGWCSFYGVFLHFCLILTKQRIVYKRWLLYPILYLPPIVFIYRHFSMAGPAIEETFHLYKLGWICFAQKDLISFWAFNIYYLLAMVTGLGIITYWGIKSTEAREKKQAKLIVGSTIVALLWGSLTDTFLPALHVQIPPMAIIFILIPIYGIYHAITKYKLMSLTPAAAADEIFSTMTETVILIKPNGEIKLPIMR